MQLAVFIALVAYIISLALAVLLLLALLVGARVRLPRFIALNLAIIATLAAGFIAQFIITEGAAQHFFVRLSLAATSLIAPALAWFVGGIVTSRVAGSRWVVKYSLLSPLLATVALLPISNLDITASKEGIAVTSSDIAYPAMLLVVFSTFAWCLVVIWRYEKKKSKNIRNTQAYRSFRYAILSALSLNLVGATFLASYTWSQMLSPISMVLMIFIMTVAIFRQRLLNVRHFVARAVAYLLLYTTLIAVFVVTALYILNRFLPSQNRVTGGTVLIFSLLLLGLVILQYPLKQLFDSITNLIFYRGTYEPQALLDDINRRILGEMEVERLTTDIARVLQQRMKLEFVAISLVDQRYIASNRKAPNQEIAAEIEKTLGELNIPVANIDKLAVHASTQGTARQLEDSRVALIVALHDGGTTVGRIYYGDKLSGEPFYENDVEFARIATGQISLAIQNALKFEEIQRFNETLKEEIAHATAGLRHANERLKTLDQLKDDFIAMASHQFRTPVGSVRQALQIINDPKTTSDERDEMLRLAEIDSEHLATIVTTMLSISRLQAGRYVVDKSLGDICSLLDAVMRSIQVLADQKSITVAIHKPEGKLMAEVDSIKLKEAMTNYIENAIKYSPAGSTITVHLSASNGRITFEVTDQGIGIPEPERKGLFTKFYRAPNARREQPEGNGIGLYVVKNIAELHGGQAYYAPAEHGSTFGLWVPTAIPAKDTKQKDSYHLAQPATIIE